MEDKQVIRHRKHINARKIRLRQNQQLNMWCLLFDRDVLLILDSFHCPPSENLFRPAKHGALRSGEKQPEGKATLDRFTFQQHSNLKCVPKGMKGN